MSKIIAATDRHEINRLDPSNPRKLLYPEIHNHLTWLHDYEGLGRDTEERLLTGAKWPGTTWGDGSIAELARRAALEA